MRKSVRILLVGDAGVGKSTLIASLNEEQFVESVEPLHEVVTVPPDVSPEKVCTYIVDSLAGDENESAVIEEIKRADVVCIVYAVNEKNTFKNVSEYWLPLMHKVLSGKTIPVILVGNKIDLRQNNTDAGTVNSSGMENGSSSKESSSSKALQRDVGEIMKRFKEIETCVECSAKLMLNIPEVFYFAQKAVLHPTSPLYDTQTGELKPECASALRRIFKLCDADKDDALNDEELSHFQERCFGSPLQQTELEGVKNFVRTNHPSGIGANGLTEEGLLFLHLTFIRRGRLETTWIVLHKFGYDDTLVLRDDFLHPQIEVKSDCTVEISSNGYRFLTQLFKNFDKDQDGALSDAELENLFATSPGNPFGALQLSGLPSTSNTANPAQASLISSSSSNLRSTFDFSVTTKEGWVTLQGFQAAWSMLTLLDYRKALEYFAYLGYPDDTKLAIKVTRSRKIDIRKRKTARNVFLAYVFGATGSGKTSFLRSFVSKDYRDVHVPTVRSICAVNAVSVQGSDKYLVLQEIPANGSDLELLVNKKKMEQCSLAVFLYDSHDPNSWAYACKLRSKIEDPAIPCVILATKSDLSPVVQTAEKQPIDVCSVYKMPVPIDFTAVNPDPAVFAALLNYAINPHLACVGLDPSQFGSLSRLFGLSSDSDSESASLSTKLILFTLFAGSVGLGAYYGYKFYQTNARLHKPK